MVSPFQAAVLVGVIVSGVCRFCIKKTCGAWFCLRWFVCNLEGMAFVLRVFVYFLAKFMKGAKICCAFVIYCTMREQLDK